MIRKILLSLAAVLLFALPALANEAPIANAGPDQNVYLGDAVRLNGSASDPDGDAIVAWMWTLEFKPAGSMARLSNPSIPAPSFIAEVAGDYILSLTVYDGVYTSALDFVVIHAAANLPPTAVIVASTTSGPAPLTVAFDGTRSSDPEGGQLSYEWNFGDGTTSHEAAPTHQYLFAGTYTVRLVITDERLALDFDTVSIEVTAANNPPTVAPSATPTSGTAPLMVQFKANATDPDGDALTYAWDFGDSATSASSNPQHTYSAPGTYVASLSVSDGALTTSASVTIVVDPALTFAVDDAKIKWTGGPQSTLGQIHLAAELFPFTPASIDVISLTVDGIELFSAPFSQFQPTDEPQVYLFKDRNLLVKLDTMAASLEVLRHKLDLSPIDTANGVEVKLQIGADTAVQTLDMTAGEGRKLTYPH